MLHFYARQLVFGKGIFVKKEEPVSWWQSNSFHWSKIFFSQSECLGNIQSKRNWNIFFMWLVTPQGWHIKGKGNQPEGPRILIVVLHLPRLLQVKKVGCVWWGAPQTFPSLVKWEDREGSSSLTDIFLLSYSNLNLQLCLPRCGCDRWWPWVNFSKLNTAMLVWFQPSRKTSQNQSI